MRLRLIVICENDQDIWYYTNPTKDSGLARYHHVLGAWISDIHSNLLAEELATEGVSEFYISVLEWRNHLGFVLWLYRCLCASLFSLLLNWGGLRSPNPITDLLIFTLLVLEEASDLSINRPIFWNRSVSFKYSVFVLSYGFLYYVSHFHVRGYGIHHK